jgi:hypothetical protein
MNNDEFTPKDAEPEQDGSGGQEAGEALESPDADGNAGDVQADREVSLALEAP